MLWLTYPIDRYPTPARLNDARECDRLAETILELGSVQKATRALGMSRVAIYQKANREPEFRQFLDAVTSTLMQALADQVIDIADGDDDPRDKHIRIDTRLRVAGKYLKRFADGPATEVNVHNDNRMAVVCDEKQRAALIEQRQRVLQLAGSKQE